VKKQIMKSFYNNEIKVDAFWLDFYEGSGAAYPNIRIPLLT